MFKTLTGVLDPRKHPTNQEIEKIPSFIFCKWLGGSPLTIQAGNQINRFYNIPVVSQYNMVKSAFGGKVKYIPYPKKEPDCTDLTTKYVQEHFNINKNLATEYIQLMDDKELAYIVDLYSNRDSK